MVCNYLSKILLKPSRSVWLCLIDRRFTIINKSFLMMFCTLFITGCIQGKLIVIFLAILLKFVTITFLNDKLVSNLTVPSWMLFGRWKWLSYLSELATGKKEGKSFYMCHNLSRPLSLWLAQACWSGVPNEFITLSWLITLVTDHF